MSEAKTTADLIGDVDIRSRVDQIDARLFQLLVDYNVSEQFQKLLIKRAEMFSRQLPRCADNRQAALISGAIMLCYELADNVEKARRLKGNADVSEARRILGVYEGMENKNAPHEFLGRGS